MDYAGVLCRPDTGYLALRGYRTELAMLLSLALEAAEQQGDPAEVGAIWQNLAVLAFNRGEMEQA